jgi:RNA polymerase sigma-70 factor (ECF subfamily)
MAGLDDHTTLSGAGRHLPATQWTRMLDANQRQVVLSEFSQTYWKPVYCYLRAMGFGNEQAKDLTQGFFTDKVLGQDLIQQADRNRGRFRSFLLRSVRNYAISVQRREKPHRSLDPDQEAGTKAGDPEWEFNRAWADGLLANVLKQLERECEQRGKTTHWQVFREWLLDPSVEQKRSMSEICKEYGIEEPNQAYHMVENVKRRFRAIFRSELVGVCETQDIEAEIREFVNIFSDDAARNRHGRRI